MDMPLAHGFAGYKDKPFFLWLIPDCVKYQPKSKKK
jgi:hypothetical protein